ncbi:hypothetical protein DOY81_009691 [Sarcophaga bullata]|nr:hypothetical protein DOY81_009691 [Sarcophaga bullata]
MKIPVHHWYFKGIFAILIAFMLNDFKVNAIHTEEGLELLFRQRTNSDWEDVWHSETHSRCRDKLVRSCIGPVKRILSLNTTHRKRTDESINKRNKPHSFLPMWINAGLAQTLLRTRRSSGHSITTECCTKAGCTWEEYAEYCPSNKRRNHY